MSEPDQTVAAPCCPLPAGVAPLAVSRRDEERQASRVARVAHALSDPLRVRMLELIVNATESRGAAPAGEAPAGATTPVAAPGEDQAEKDAPVPAGVCACEFQGLYGIGQSRVSYHLKVLREAGLVREQRRGKWSFYALDETAARAFSAELGDLLRL